MDAVVLTTVTRSAEILSQDFAALHTDTVDLRPSIVTSLPAARADAPCQTGSLYCPRPRP